MKFLSKLFGRKPAPVAAAVPAKAPANAGLSFPPRPRMPDWVKEDPAPRSSRVVETTTTADPIGMMNPLNPISPLSPLNPINQPTPSYDPPAPSHTPSHDCTPSYSSPAPSDSYCSPSYSDSSPSYSDSSTY